MHDQKSSLSSQPLCMARETTSDTAVAHSQVSNSSFWTSYCNFPRGVAPILLLSGIPSPSLLSLSSPPVKLVGGLHAVPHRVGSRLLPLRHRSCWWLELGSHHLESKRTHQKCIQVFIEFSLPFPFCFLFGWRTSGFLILHVPKGAQHCEKNQRCWEGSWTTRV